MLEQSDPLARQVPVQGLFWPSALLHKFLCNPFVVHLCCVVSRRVLWDEDDIKLLLRYRSQSICLKAFRSFREQVGVCHSICCTTHTDRHFTFSLVLQGADLPRSPGHLAAHLGRAGGLCNPVGPGVEHRQGIRCAAASSHSTQDEQRCSLRCL